MVAPDVSRKAGNQPSINQSINQPNLLTHRTTCASRKASGSSHAAYEPMVQLMVRDWVVTRGSACSCHFRMQLPFKGQLKGNGKSRGRGGDGKRRVWDEAKKKRGKEGQGLGRGMIGDLPPDEVAYSRVDQLGHMPRKEEELACRPRYGAGHATVGCQQPAGARRCHKWCGELMHNSWTTR